MDILVNDPPFSLLASVVLSGKLNFAMNYPIYGFKIIAMVGIRISLERIKKVKLSPNTTIEMSRHIYFIPTIPVVSSSKNSAISSGSINSIWGKDLYGCKESSFKGGINTVDTTSCPYKAPSRCFKG